MKRCILIVIGFILITQNLPADRFIPKSDLINKVLNIVSHLYVDSNRIRPVSMLEGSLERLSLKIAPVLTQFEQKQNKIEVDVRVDQFRRSFAFNTPNNINDLNDILQQIVRFVKQYLESEEKPENVDYAVINGFLRQLDPHSSLLIPEIYSDFSTQTSGNFGGVGMMISIRDGALTIISPIDNTPASRAGLRAKDKIVQINEESTVNMSLSDAVKKLRGKAGTEVDIFIMRKSFSSPRKYTIVRDIIEITSVKSFVFENNGDRVGLLKINTFQQNTIDEINTHLEDLDYDLKNFQGLIIDLRNNPGGLLDQAIKVSDRFLSDGVIVSTAGLRQNSIKSYSAHWFRSITSIPIIVLINNGSASASEIVTAALKKNERAVVLGIQTFGKGSVQQVIPFPSGSALRLTTSKYLTPGNISIQSVGVSPHIAMNPYYISSDFLHVTSPRLDRAENSLEQNFSEWGDKAEPPIKSSFYLYDNEKEDKEDEADEEMSHHELEFARLQEDFLVQTAIDILLKNQRNRFSNLLKTAVNHVNSDESKQDQKLIDRFASFTPPIDWKSYPKVPAGVIKTRSWIELKTENRDKEAIWKPIDGAIPADSEIRIHLEAKNVGTARISKLLAVSESENELFDDRQFAFGKLDPGKLMSWYVPVTISESAPSRNDKVSFSFADEYKREIHEAFMTVQTEQKPIPEFEYSISILDNNESDSKGNGNGIIEVGESITVKVDITNKGKGSSGALTLLLKNGEGKNVFLNVGRQSIDQLALGDTSSAYFQFDFKKYPSDEDLDFSLDIIDSVFSISSLNQKIKLPLSRRITTITNRPPSIEISAPLTSGKNQFLMEGAIIDQSGVKDVYIFNNKKKIFYKNFIGLKERSQVQFDLQVNLEDEYSKIIVISRDDQNVISQKNLYVRNTEFKQLQ